MIDTEREARPEHPGWRPWWVRRAEFEGRAIWITDTALAPSGAVHWRNPPRYLALEDRGDPSCGDPKTCPQPDIPHGWSFFATDSLAEAEAAFCAAERRLLAGEFQEER